MKNVGAFEKRTVSDINHDIFEGMREIMVTETSNPLSERLWHMGLGELGDAVDWLERNYELTRRANNHHEKTRRNL